MFLVSMIIIPWITLIPFTVVPMLGTAMLGKHNDIILYLFMVTGPVFFILQFSMTLGGRAAITLVGKQRNEHIRGYIAQVHNTLLNTETGQKEQLKKLTMEQRTVEAFARDVNNKMGAFQSVEIFTTGSWVIIYLLSAALLSTKSAGDDNLLRPILALCMLTMIFTFGLWNNMKAATSPSRTWNAACDRLLNDAALAPVVNTIWGRRHDFDRWLNNHEMSSLRLFKIKVDMQRVRQAGSVLVSVIAFAIYLIARQELMSLL